jgi:methylenetetrahydrofolate dehydrogenase (NADP+)/methenyltetrahydrofolate cyclohydrolase
MTDVAERIDGKAVADQVRSEVRSEVAEFRRRFGFAPGLATVLVGDDPASATYVRNKRKACAECGIESLHHELGASTSQGELLALVKRLNERRDAHGILVQLPLPAGLDSQAILEALDPAKDVDGLHPLNQARLMAGTEGLRPCTPLGVMRLLDSKNVELKGARAVVVGRSLLVGKPLALLLLERHATVTLCHSRTRSLAEEIGRADVVIAAIGKARLIEGAWIRPGATVIDVGINRGADGKLVGDVDFEGASQRARYITPVPGGVGPMTIAMLLKNTLTAATRQEEARLGRSA